MYKLKLKGFTLIEMLVVISILSILATISLLSFKGYTKNTRDTSRIGSIVNIESTLETYKTVNSTYPLPDNYTQVQASGAIIGYEGKVGDSVSSSLGIQETPKDPFDGSNYVYYLNQDKTKFQLMTYLEGSDYMNLGFISNAYAGYETRILKFRGTSLGIILDSQKNVLTGSTFEIKTTNSNYTAYFGDNDYITSSGSNLYSVIYNKRTDLLKNKNLANLDDSLVGYWDMETLNGGKLKDFSKYSNDGTLTGGIVIGGQEGFKGNGTIFNGTTTNIILNTIQSQITKNRITMSLWVKPNSKPSTSYIVLGTYGLGNGGYLEVYNGDGATCTGVKFGYWTYTGVNNFVQSSNVCYNLKKWYNLTTVFDGNRQYLYIDGVLSNSIALNNANIVNSAGELYIGGVNIGAPGTPSYRILDGLLDEVRIYNRALSDSEIKNLYISNN